MSFSLGYPLINCSSGAGAVFNAATGALSVNTLPALARLTAASSQVFITGSSGTTKAVQINLVLDSNGALVSGVAGNDLVVKGSIDATYNNSGPDGALLVGEVLGFTYFDDASNTDNAEIRCRITGGSLAAHAGFLGMDIGINLRLTSVSSGAAVNWAQSFTSSANGTALGPIAPLAQAHSLAGGELAGAGALVGGAISQVHALAGAGLAGAGDLESGAIRQIHALAGGELAGVGELVGGAISQVHALAGTGLAGAGALVGGEIVLAQRLGDILRPALIRATPRRATIPATPKRFLWRAHNG